MPYFPQVIVGKIMTQAPYLATASYETVVVDMESGPKLTYSRRGAGLTNFPTGPLWKFTHQLTLTKTELATLRAFFDDRGGPLEEFIYLDPAGNLVPDSETFSVTAWEKNGVTVGSAYADPYGGTRATICTATTSNSNINTMILPAGFASGMRLCGSVWVNPAAVGTLAIGFIDAGFSVLSHSIVDLPRANEWYRIEHSFEVASNSTIRLLIGGFGTWNSSVLRLFGAQCVPMPGAGAYVKSPELYGYHAKCRFDQDELRWKNIGPNLYSVALNIKETF